MIVVGNKKMKTGEHTMTDSTSEHLALDSKALNKFSRQIAALGE